MNNENDNPKNNENNENNNNNENNVNKNININEEYRNYDENNKNYDKISKCYLMNHKYQTFDYVLKMKNEYKKCNKYKLSIFEIIKLMDDIIDESDPDNDRPQIYHFIQTAESCRKLYPDLDWFHLVGFLHDLGKILAHPKLFNLPQWSVVGDTFPVGCKFSDQIVYSNYFIYNNDTKNELYNTKYGIYHNNIGFDNVHFSWSHDEYIYMICKHNKCTLPEEALYIMRYHSFYSHHTNRSYDHLASNYDLKMLKYLCDFQKCDLYSKINEEINLDDYLPYYLDLIKKYFPSDILEI